MKILILVHGLGIGGAEMMVAHLARHLRAAGDVVEIDCIGELGALYEKLRSEGFQVVLHGRKPGFDASLPLRLAVRLRRERFDVVHAHQRTAHFYGSIAGLLDRTPLVYSEHGPWFGPGPSRRGKLFNRLLGWRAQRVTVVAEAVKRSLVEREGWRARRMDLVPNGVDLRRFEISTPARRERARRAAGLPREAAVVGAVGRFELVKNQRLLLRAFARLGKIPNPLLVLVGDGAERDALGRLAADLGVERSVRFLGVVEEVADVLPAFDVFCLSSLAEGIPLAMLEAMATGIPVIATAAGGVPEAACPAREAIIVEGPPPDCREPLDDAGREYVERFAAAIEGVLLDPAGQRQMLERARARVAEQFSMDLVCSRYAEILRQAAR